MSATPTILIAARDEEGRIAETIAALRRELPDATVIVADDGSRDRTARVAEAAGARVLRMPRRGKGQALTLAEQKAPPGPLLLCDADVRGALAASLLASGADLTVAAFADRRGGGFGIAKGTARALIRARTGFRPREPLSGQRALTQRARERCFPLAAGFGCEVAMTVDALEAGLTVHEVELALSHRATGRDAAGFAHRGRQLADALLALGPQGSQPPRAAPAARRLAARPGWRPGRHGHRRRRDRRRSLGRTGARCPCPPPRAPHDRRPEARRHPRRRPARHAQGLGSAARRARGEPLEPTRHETWAGAQGIPHRGTPPARVAAAGRRPTTLRLS